MTGSASRNHRRCSVHVYGMEISQEALLRSSDFGLGASTKLKSGDSGQAVLSLWRERLVPEFPACCFNEAPRPKSEPKRDLQCNNQPGDGSVNAVGVPPCACMRVHKNTKQTVIILNNSVNSRTNAHQLNLYPQCLQPAQSSAATFYPLSAIRVF